MIPSIEHREFVARLRRCLPRSGRAVPIAKLRKHFADLGSDFEAYLVGAAVEGDIELVEGQGEGAVWDPVSQRHFVAAKRA